MRGRSIDRDMIHDILYEMTSSAGVVRLVQRDLAKELDLVPETICRVLKKMSDEGRIRRISSRKNNVGVYSVTNPSDWKIRQRNIQS